LVDAAVQRPVFERFAVSRPDSFLGVLEVGIVGLPGSGRSTLFAALTGGHGSVGTAEIRDERLAPVAAAVGSGTATPAVLKVVEVAGTGPALLGNLRQVDALLAVVDGFSGTRDPAADRESLQLELRVADRDHVEKRLERVRSQAKSGDPQLKEEVAALERLLAHLEAAKPLSEWGEELPAELEPLTTKPLVTIENGPAGIDLKLEAELAELPEAEAAEFREGPSALEAVLQDVFEAAELITFFTANEKEARAWTLRRGATALDAAGAVHTDLARGFVRCEVIPWSDLVESGSRADASRRGLQRVEGKTYVVEDGDVLNVRSSI
jgi:ribosome-binding ATPase YchF (GTP1/OBG family)